jgi:hypothetical protein
MVFFLLSPGVKILFLKKIFYKKDASRVKCPAAAAGPEGLWPGGSCGASNSQKNFPPP